MEKTKFFAHSSAIIDQPTQIGKGTHIWHFTHIRENVTIGEKCNIGQNVYIDTAVSVGNGVKIQNNVSLYNGIICEDDVFIGPSAVFTNVINPRSFIERKTEFRKTVIRKGATIGANATVICGHEIGKYALIGAGSIVTKDTKSYALVVGNPAQQIGWVSENGQTLQFNGEGFAECPISKEKYQLKNGEVHKL